MIGDASSKSFASPIDYDDDTDLAQTWAYIDGIAAYERGEPRDTNPFPASNRCYHVWLLGWLAVCHERG